MTLELKVPLAASVECPAEARHATARFLAEHGVAERAIADAALIVSELVTNAVCYGSEPVDLAVVVDDDRVVIEVTDAEPGPESMVATRAGRGFGSRARLRDRRGGGTTLGCHSPCW